MKTIRLAENLDYAMGLQSLERLEKSWKVNTVERKMLRDILEDADGKPKEGDILNLLKKELKRIKEAENRDQVETVVRQEEEPKVRHQRDIRVNCLKR